MEEKNKIENASGTVKRTRKKSDTRSLSEKLAALAEQRALEARYAEEYRKKLLEERELETPVAEVEESSVAEVEEKAYPEAELSLSEQNNEDNLEEPEEDLSVEGESDPAESETADEEEAVSAAMEEISSQTEEDNAVTDESEIKEDADGEQTASDEENVTEATSEQSAEPQAEEEPGEQKKTEADNGKKKENATVRRPVMKGFIAIPMYTYPQMNGGMPYYGVPTPQTASSPSAAGTPFAAPAMPQQGNPAPKQYAGIDPMLAAAMAAAHSVPMEVDPASDAVGLGEAYGTPVNTDPTSETVRYGEAYGTPVSTDPTSGTVRFGEAYGTPVSTDSTSGAVRLSEYYGATINAEPSPDTVGLGETYGTTVNSSPELDNVRLGEAYGSSVSADPSLRAVSFGGGYADSLSAAVSTGAVDLGETYSSPIDVNTSRLDPVSLYDGYTSPYLRADESDFDRLLHEGGEEFEDLMYDHEPTRGPEEYPEFPDIDLRPSTVSMDTIDLATDKIDENVILIEERMTHEIKVLKRTAKMHGYTFALDSGAHYATTRDLRRGMNRRLSKVAKAKKLEKKAARRYYLATLDKHAGDMKKRKRNRELISSILRRLEFLMEERSRINQRLIQLYTGKQYGEGDKNDLGVRQFNRAAKDMYKKQKREARRVSKLYVERDVKERILELMNERTECAARVAFIKRQLKSRNLARQRRKTLKKELRESRRKLKYLGLDIKLFIKKAEMKHERNNTDRLQRTLIGAIIFTAGVLAIVYFAFKTQIDAFIAGLL